MDLYKEFSCTFNEFKVFGPHPETQFKKFYDLVIAKVSFRIKI